MGTLEGYKETLVDLSDGPLDLPLDAKLRVVLVVDSEADATFVIAVAKELARARSLFPDSICAFPALIEEVGELAEELYVTGRTEAAIQEAIQVAVMAQRVAIDGDKSITIESHLCRVMWLLGEVARTSLKMAAGKRSALDWSAAMQSFEDAVYKLRHYNGDPTIRVTDPTVIGNM